MSGGDTATLYAIAAGEMMRLAELYLSLTERTHDLAILDAADMETEDTRRLLLAGTGSSVDPTTATAPDALAEWERRRAIPFDVEIGVTTGVYVHLRQAADRIYDALNEATRGFTVLDPAFISAHPQYLPFLQHVGGSFSKAQLKRQVGSVSDTSISRPAGERLAAYLTARVDPASIRKGEILRRLDSTLEGIVRDLVGRLLLESVVASALERERLPFVREKDYAGLTGVVYDFRADFVLPNAETPKVFVEVRKSSTRHASLYAKDKMFSAINWKGHRRDLLGVLVVEGPWTGATLQIMAKVFDYVVPLGRSAELAQTIAAYLAGDTSKLRWLIDFRISENRG